MKQMTYLLPSLLLFSCAILSLETAVFAQTDITKPDVMTLHGDRLVAGNRPNSPLSLKDAVRIGLANSPNVAGAEADVQMSASDTRAARSRLQPKLYANTFATIGSESSIIGTPVDSGGGTTFTVPAHNFADQNLTLMAPIYTAGRLTGLVTAAIQRQRSALSTAQATRADTALAIKSAYYRVLLNGEMVKAAASKESAVQSLVETTRSQFESGKGIEAALQRAEAESADAHRALVLSQNEVEKALLDLKSNMGISFDASVVLSDTLQWNERDLSQAALIAEGLHRRPEIVAAEARIAAAGGEMRAAKGAWAPQIYATLMADGNTSQDMGSSAGVTLGLTASIPIVDGGQRRADVDRARALRQRAESDLRATRIRAESEIRQAYLDAQTSSETYKSAQAGLQAAQASYDVMRLRVQNGKSIELEELDALSALTQARASLAQALYDHALAAAQLDRAVGRPTE